MKKVFSNISFNILFFFPPKSKTLFPSIFAFFLFQISVLPVFSKSASDRLHNTLRHIPLISCLLSLCLAANTPPVMQA